MIGVVVPAHNEAATLAACVASIRLAAHHPALAGEVVRIVVVLDRCVDDSAHIARRVAVEHMAIHSANVGHARAVGTARVLDAGARWIATTDADTVVASDWLAQQLALGADLACGTVGVAWHAARDRHLRQVYDRHYVDADGHRHVHGANLGFSASAYRRAGGFIALPCHEDVALVRAITRIGSAVAWTARPRVITSARREARVRGGFGHTLARMATG